MISIWILPYDPFGDERMIYTVKNIVTENNQIVYNDGVTKIFLYTGGTKGGSQRLKDLLIFMENPIRDNAVDEELLSILGIIDTIKGDPKESDRYMGIMGVIDYERRDAYEDGHATGYEDGHASGYQDGHEEGREEGRKEGHKEGRIQGAVENCKFMNADRDTAKAAIMRQFAVTEDKAEEYLKLYW